MKHLSALTFTIFSFFMGHGQSLPFSVVINEILADPSPVVGLPNTEFIELKNISKQPVNLLKWKISNGSTTASISTNYLLQPDSLVVLCTKTQAVFFSNASTTLGVTSFPSLVNDGDVISLIAPEGITIHAVKYDLTDYHNQLKSEGGWSLEIIDPYHPCNKNNLTSSIHYSGGTPGKENSVFKPTTAETAVHPTQCIAIDATHLLLTLDQGLDSISAANSAMYMMNPGNIHPAIVKLNSPLFNQVALQFSSPLKDFFIYQIDAYGLKHCNSSTTDSISVQTGIIHDAMKDSLMINEILFNPPSGGADFIELYNNSHAVMNMKNIYLTNRSSAGSLGSIYQASLTDLNLFPETYMCISTDTSFIKSMWKSAPDKHLQQVGALPSLPDDEGDLVILNKQGEPVDEFKYDENMHFPLIREREGVSLERIQANTATQNTTNWHSAAASAGYATPGYVNSQHELIIEKDNSFNIQPDVISPNNDSIDDILNIHYHFDVSGYMSSVYLFNNRGVLLCKLADNILCGKDGVILWDGTINNKKAPMGMYYIVMEAFNLNGSKISRKWMVGVK